MRLFKICFAAFAVLPFAAACGGGDQTARNGNAGAAATAPSPQAATPAPTATPDELAAAAADYSQFCIKCHKADGTGGSVELDDGKKIKVESLREHGLKDSDAHLAKQIREGGDDMPAFKGRLDEQRIDNLVRYVRREFHGRKPGALAAAGTAGTPAKASH
jgi:mono/diheme cytochrome c family protein